jgi:hypothetical protein
MAFGLVVDEDVAPQPAITGGDSCAIEKTFARQRKDLIRLRHHQGRSERVRQVADVREHPIMIVGAQARHAHPQFLPK